MYETILGLVLFFLIGYIHDSNSQSAIEGNINYVRILETNFLDKPKFRPLLGNPETDDSGLIPANRAIGFEIDLSYVKQFSKKFSWIISGGYIQRQEQAKCFCHVCDKLPSRSNFLDVKNFELGFAGRYLVANYKNTRFSLESGFRFAILGNYTEAHYLEYEMSAVAIRELTNELAIKFLFGLQKSFGSYKRTGATIGIGIAKLMIEES